MLLRRVRPTVQISVNKRGFFKDLGITDATENNILLATKDGIYSRSRFIRLTKNREAKTDI